MSRTPPEIEVPYYDRNDYYDSYCKFLMYGDLKGEMSDQIRIYNKVGLAFGTLTDVAYIKDQQVLSFFWLQRFWLIITKFLTTVNMSTTSWGFLSLGLSEAVYEYETLKEDLNFQNKYLNKRTYLSVERAEINYLMSSN